MTTEADKAVRHTLNRVQTDADLSYLMLGTEAHSLLCAAEAATTGESLDVVKARREQLRAKYPRRYYSTHDVRHAVGEALHKQGLDVDMRDAEARALDVFAATRFSAQDETVTTSTEGA